MNPTLSRRQFHAALAATGLGFLTPFVKAADSAPPQSTSDKLPTVRWGQHSISKLLVGHNPIKGISHFSRELDQEMKTWYAELDNGKALLKRCQQAGINTAQMGSPPIEAMLRSHYADGGKMQWIATFYSKPGPSAKVELARILKMDPKPIGAQHFGGTTDALMRAGQIDQARDTLKMLRDAGLLVGLCSHNHEVIDYAESKGWDVDFYQCSFYRSTDSLNPEKKGEVFEEEARQSMVKTIQQVKKPCIAFKVLGANRHCATPQSLAKALEFALTSIKPTDVVLLGMWQKLRDQVGENTTLARTVLAMKAD